MKYVNIFYHLNNYLDSLPEEQSNLLKNNAIFIFKGKYNFLSNFHHSPFTLEFNNYKITYLTVEHFYQACKATTIEDHLYIAKSPSPQVSKQRGRHTKYNPNWENIKEEIMQFGLYFKFKYNQDLLNKLLSTYPKYLIEGNTWNDTFYGFDLIKRKGKNRLGELLTYIRNKIRETSDIESIYPINKTISFNPFTYMT